jgi:hypothetical protein
MTIVIRDEFQGTGNLTGRVPDLKPLSMTSWTTKISTMLLDTAGGYAYGPGSASASTMSSGANLGNIAVPQNHGFSSVGKITIGFTMGTSNAALPGGFTAIGVDIGIFINNNGGFTAALSGTNAGGWSMYFPGRSSGPFESAVSTPSINTDYEFIIQYTETSFTLSWNGNSYTFPANNTHVSGLNAISIGTASRTGGGVLWRYLQVEDFGGATPIMVFTT